MIKFDILILNSWESKMHPELWHRSEKNKMASHSVSLSFCLGQVGLGYSILTYPPSCSSIFNEDCWFFEISLISRLFGDDNSGLALGKIVKYVELGIVDPVSYCLPTLILLSHLTPFLFLSTNKMNKNSSSLTLSPHKITLLLCISSGILLFMMKFHANFRLRSRPWRPLKTPF